MFDSSFRDLANNLIIENNKIRDKMVLSSEVRIALLELLLLRFIIFCKLLDVYFTFFTIYPFPARIASIFTQAGSFITTLARVIAHFSAVITKMVIITFFEIKAKTSSFQVVHYPK